MSMSVKKVSGMLKQGLLILRQNLPFYIAGFLVVFALRRYYSVAGADGMGWLLYPTALWSKALSGVPFERAAGVGFINHQVKFIIAPSCSGIRFMLITYSALLYSFVHRMATTPLKSAWAVLCLGVSYLFTILVNGVRIVLSLHLLNPGTRPEWIGPETLHTYEGAALFLVSLFILYQAADHSSRLLTGAPGQVRQGRRAAEAALGYSAPVLWYLFFLLAIPMLNRLLLLWR